MEAHNTMVDRLAYVEKFMGESLDKHEKELKEHRADYIEHKTSVNTRLEFVETLIGDSADKHAKELAAATQKMADLREALLACATKENHANLEQRMAYLEKFFCESAYEHEKEIAETKKIYMEHKTKMEKHLEYIEKLLRSLQQPMSTTAIP